MAPPPAPGQMPQMTSAYPGTQMYMPMHAQTVPMGAMASSVPMAYYPMGAVYPPGSTVMVDGGFDAGARFGPGTGSSIPVSRFPLNMMCFISQKRDFHYISQIVFIFEGHNVGKTFRNPASSQKKIKLFIIIFKLKT